jgi:hypothetical protein
MVTGGRPITRQRRSGTTKVTTAQPRPVPPNNSRSRRRWLPFIKTCTIENLYLPQLQDASGTWFNTWRDHAIGFAVCRNIATTLPNSRRCRQLCTRRWRQGKSFAATGGYVIVEPGWRIDCAFDPRSFFELPLKLGSDVRSRLS